MCAFARRLSATCIGERRRSSSDWRPLCGTSYRTSTHAWIPLLCSRAPIRPRLRHQHRLPPSRMPKLPPSSTTARRPPLPTARPSRPAARRRWRPQSPNGNPTPNPTPWYDYILYSYTNTHNTFIYTAYSYTSTDIRRIHVYCTVCANY